MIVGPKILAPSIVERTLLLARMFNWELWLMILLTALALAVGTTYMRHSRYIGVGLVARVMMRDDVRLHLVHVHDDAAHDRT